MRAFVLDAPGNFSIRELPTPAPRAGEVLLRVAACGICGSDVPRVMETGAYHHPIIPGHELSGYVTAVGDGVDKSIIGKAVAIYPLIPCGKCEQCASGLFNLCEHYDYLGSRRDGGFSEFAVAPSQNLVPIPDGMPVEHAALSEPAAVALHGLKNVQLGKGESVLVFGAGSIGLLVCQIARLMGSGEVFVFDTVKWKIELAEEHGWATGIDKSEFSSNLPWKVNVIVDAVGAPTILPDAFRVAGKRSRILLIGNPHGDVRLEKALLSRLLRNELQITGSWNSLLEPEWRQVLEWMASKELVVEPLITHRIGLDELPEAFVKLHSGKLQSIKVLVIP